MAYTRVAVLRGGPSEEHDVSMQSGKSVLEILKESHYEPLDVVISQKGEWLEHGYVRNPHDILEKVDVVFLALHGSYGEDGTIQRLLDTAGVPYTGSGAFPSTVAINKVLTKDTLRDKGLLMARHMLVGDSVKGNIPGIVDSVTSLFGPRYVVKPAKGGSSIGTTIIEGKDMLLAAIAKGLETYDQLLVEECIAGVEATCGVINNFRNEEVYVLPPIEIVPPQGAGFFDYRVKYDGSTQEICPGRFPWEVKEKIMDTAKLVHTTLGLSQYSRSDFIVAGGDVYFLEVNTLPGLTPESLFPVALDAVGCGYGDFIVHLLSDALEQREQAVLTR